ncbi:hypothetical protein GH714_032743 [Hevea brasiliensis]|uniref:Guanylate kinase/L-type calcium channel beta subunit domain-containing protein n=1 Tax=Hevea brasiliensis TaxID=3981 RepID=A0A6A6M683_HEVBR|nr:hypothetical protein GH714_032743 [Hevea brasiliensis]
MLLWSIGKGPAFIVDDLQNEYQNGFGFKREGCEIAITIQDRKVRILDRRFAMMNLHCLGVRIFDKATGNWEIPTVLGTKPKPCKGHSAVSLNDGRILIIKKGFAPDDCIWFLEVDTEYVKKQKKGLGTEVVAWSKGVRGNVERPVVISGPSGVGARSVRDSTLEAIFIFICPPSMEELGKRLRARGTEAEEQILKRLENAEARWNKESHQASLITFVITINLKIVMRTSRNSCGWMELQ